MENSTEMNSLVTEPIYFFDQMKPKRKKWRKRKIQEFLPRVSRHRKSVRYEEVKEEKVSVLVTSQCFCKCPRISGVSGSSAGLKHVQDYQQNNLYEDCKLIATELLYELEVILQIYAEYNFIFPVGVENLVTYSWYDLIKYSSMTATKNSPLKTNDRRGTYSSISSIGSISSSVSTTTKRNSSVGNYMKKEQDDRPSISSKPKEKTLLVSQHLQNSHNSNLPVIIHFSLTSKKCYDNGWIFLDPSPSEDILKWRSILSTAVEKLQEALSQIKADEAKLKESGLNKQLIIDNYNDTEIVVKERCSIQKVQCFWLEMLKSKPQMPTIKDDNPDVKKFHYSLMDGSSLIYYPSGRLAVCQSNSTLPFGGMYTNIFCSYHRRVILGTFTPFGCGSISFPKSHIISMMFNQDGGMVISKTGSIIREWMWPSNGKLKEPVLITVNEYITVNISGRFAITLTYEAYSKSLQLSLAPVKCKSCCPCLPELLFSDASSVSRDARELYKIYKIKCSQMKPITQKIKSLNLSEPVDVSSFETVMDISLLYDIETAIKIRKLQRKAKHLLLHWLNYYRLAMGFPSVHNCGIPRFLQKATKRQKVPSVEFSLRKSAKENDELKEYARYRYTFLKLKGFYSLSPIPHVQKTSVSKLPRYPTSSLNMNAFQLTCPVVLRSVLRGLDGDTCRCSASIIPEVTDLEYDYLIVDQLSSLDQTIIVYVFSAKEKDTTMKEVAKLYRELNKSRRMPCIESRLDAFRIFKYNIISASKFTGGKCPLLVQRHNVIPGIILMYIQGKLLFANFIFNGYSTSAKDLQKQILKTRNDFHMGYFLPSDFRVQ